MNPHQRNKVDISKMTEEEQKLFRLYGKLPKPKGLLTKQLQERKYFDSGDYALSQAGKSSPQSVGTAIPSPENIPHHKHGLSNEIGVGSPISPSPTTFTTTTTVSSEGIPVQAETAISGTSPTHSSGLRAGVTSMVDDDEETATKS
ncbi:Endosulfine-domain-containing protein [Atractiella rhizophila]|nr:Endosulfine-domain-containing protein [Atractiella rhizophila]